MHFDIFNGDADGICALIQLRLDQPRDAKLVTGVKRDIALLEKVEAREGDSLTVLDISLQKNQRKVYEFLAHGVEIFYVDHHQPGDIPAHPKLTALIDTSNDVCTSLLVNQHLQGKFPLWAVTAAFGDNLQQSAEKLASTLSINTGDLERLKNLGVYVNYNGYGASVEDLHFSPDQLYREMAAFSSPLDFMVSNKAAFEKLESGYRQDMSVALNTKPVFTNDRVAVFLLPDEAWARRVSGVYSNDLANLNPDLAHAVLTINDEGGYLVSVRAPLSNKSGADEFCSGFPTGGGRKSAAGINHLQQDQLETFIQKFGAFYAAKRV
jgi:nanoRNase/pAp phosphatase (c-di-AMP/oligoRNAs hydrolase)